MGVNFNTDYSTLFSSMAGNKSSNLNSLFGNANDSFGFSITDYASIKNGSYGKLTKAYYSTAQSEKTVQTKANKEYNEKLSNVKSGAEDLKDAVKSLESALKGNSTDKIVSAAKDFASAYNDLVSSVDKAEVKTITKSAQNMVNEIGSNLRLLDSAGFSLDEKGVMSVDEEKVKKNPSSLKTLFNSAGSLGDHIAAKATSIFNSAKGKMNSQNTYTAKAAYSPNVNTGVSYDSIT